MVHWRVAWDKWNEASERNTFHFPMFIHSRLMYIQHTGTPAESLLQGRGHKLWIETLKHCVVHLTTLHLTTECEARDMNPDDTVSVTCSTSWRWLWLLQTWHLITLTTENIFWKITFLYLLSVIHFLLKCHEVLREYSLSSVYLLHY